MNFTVIECEQRTPEWYAARVGVLTASEAQAMLSRPRKKDQVETEGRRVLRCRLALELVKGATVEAPEDRYVTPWMQRGIDREAEAIGKYEARFGELVQPVGFVRHNTLPIGCSPDGIVGDFDGGVEVKNVKWTTQLDYHDLKNEVPSEYRAQVTHSLFVTELPWWDFVSYCPEVPGSGDLYRVRVMRDAVDLDAYALAFRLFWNEVEKEAEAMRERFALED
jgi:exodeoxyribonuclease (lambda-induced)